MDQVDTAADATSKKDFSNWRSTVRRNASEEELNDISNAVRLSFPDDRYSYAITNFQPKNAEEWKTYHRQWSELSRFESMKKGVSFSESHADKAQVEDSKELENTADVKASNPKESTTSSPLVKTTYHTSAQDLSNQDKMEAEQSTQSSLPPKRATVTENMESRMETMSKILENQLPFIDHPDGDTLVFIDPASQQPEVDNETYEAYKRSYSQAVRMHSSTFHRLGSPFFDKAFGPTAQHRVLRRLHLANKLPHGVKYVLDLTPPVEGDDAVYLATELSCSMSVRRWYRGRDRWKISHTLICAPEEWIPQADNEASRSERQLYYREISECCGPIHDRQALLDRIAKSHFSLSPDLSPIRHRSSIQRILLAIDGQDPQLKSAPMMWTTAALAKYFEISGKPNDPLVDYVVRWLRASPNSLFVEALPEETLKIADSFNNEELCRESFAVLVGEQALEVEYSRGHGGKSSLLKSRTVFGRNKSEIHESYQTRIEYARASLIERVRKTSIELLQAHWVEELPEMSYFNTQNVREILPQGGAFMESFKKWIRGWILAWLSNQRVYTEKGSNFEEYLFPVNGYQLTWNTLSPYERIFCRSFWTTLSRESVDDQDQSYREETLNQFKWQESQYGATPHEAFDLKTLRSLSRNDLLVALKHDTGLLRATGAIPNVPPRSGLAANAQQLPRTYGNIADLMCGQSFAFQEYQNGTGNLSARSSASPMDADQSLSQSNLEGEVYRTPILHILFVQATGHIHRVARQMLESPGSQNGSDIEITNTLVCLQESEYKYLPLWAGGLDDETGGVFNDEVPIAEHGFTAAGPSVHTNNGSANSMSSFAEPGGSSKDSHATSTVVNDGFSDTLDRRRVYAASEVSSEANRDDLWQKIRELKTPVSETGDTEYETLKSATIYEESDNMSRADNDDAQAQAATEEIRRLEVAQENEKRFSSEAKGKGREVPEQDVDDMLDMDDFEDDYDGFDGEVDMTNSDDAGTEKAFGDSDDEDMVMV